MTTLLMLLTTLAAVALLAVLAVYGWRIAALLEGIGNREPAHTNRGGDERSLLARIAFGVAAIERQVAALPPQATRLNESLALLAAAMTELKAELKGALDAIEAQRGERGGS